jgi:hypothetical protein
MARTTQPTPKPSKPIPTASESPELGETVQDELGEDLVQDILRALQQQEQSVLKRNAAIDTRYINTYQDGLVQGLPVKNNFDSTRYNFLRRIPEIMTAQLMGRGFNITSTYDKEDLSVYDLPTSNPQDQADNQTRKQQTEILNARRQADADLRVEMAKSIIDDNGGMGIFNDGAKMGSYAGITVYKHWKDSEAKRYNIVLLENPNNFWRKFTDTNFRDSDWSCYAYQISESEAYRRYGDYLKGDDTQFQLSKPGGNIWNQAAAEDINDEPQPMVWVIDITGFIDCWSATGNGERATLKKVKRGKETEMNALVVGGILCHVRIDDLPHYTVIDNLHEPMNPWGVSDITDEAISINKTIMQVAQYWVTLGIKSLFYKLKFKGFEALNIPKNLDMEVQALPMDVDQDVAAVQQPQTFGEFQRILEWLIQSFVRTTRISRVMFDDPDLTLNSNEAMLTSMKGLIDTVEDKQTRWTPAITEILTTGVTECADFDPALKDAVNSGDGWVFRVEWPSVIRRETAQWQQMWHNNFTSGLASPQTVMEKLGIENPSEEIDRIRDSMNDPIGAAMLGRALPELAGFTIKKSVGMPPWGYVIPKVQLRGDLAPEEVGNMSHNYGWDSGPYGAGIGPTGYAGLKADDAFLNSGFVTAGNVPPEGFTPVPPGAGGADQQGQPPLSPDVSNPSASAAPASQPGVSQATPVSPQGAINQRNQQGR